MTHKLIDIPEETYNRLTELKRANETIPDLLTRLIDSSNELKEGLSASEKKIIDKLNLALKKFKEDTINLLDDWDGQGSKSFSEELWQNVIDFLLLIYIELHAEELEAPFPLVLPNVDGSLDIDWETESFELLINFPPDPST
jgi:predicted CopG family antitoxin